jgi:hypothetical protein
MLFSPAEINAASAAAGFDIDLGQARAGAGTRYSAAVPDPAVHIRIRPGTRYYGPGN